MAGNKTGLAILGLLLMLGQAAFARERDPARTEAERSGKAALAASERYAGGFRVLRFSNPGSSTPLDVALWYPTAASPRRHVYGGSTAAMLALDGPISARACPCPALVFSHGYGGSGLGIAFLAEALAARGWIVASPDHHDRYSAVRIRGGQVPGFDRVRLLQHAKEISRSEPGDRSQYLWRIDELRAVVDGLLADAEFGPAIDRDRLALGGHSLGGFTALGLSGTLPERADSRFQALLLFSTGAGGYLFTAEELHRVKVPALLLTGEKERTQKRGAETMEQISARIYQSLAGPKHWVEIAGATHFSFNNRFSDAVGARMMSGSEEQFEDIQRYSIAFLERYVLKRPAGLAVLTGADAHSIRAQHSRGGECR